MLKSEIEEAKAQILSISGVNPKSCMICGKCSGTCPNYDEMEYHPHQFVQMVERYMKSHQNATVDQLLKNNNYKDFH